MNLHETVLGQKFYQVQIPALITAIQDVAAALKQKPAVLQVPFEGDADELLWDLCFGNYEPLRDAFPVEEEKSQAELEYLRRLQDSLSREQQHLFNCYCTAQHVRSADELVQAFAAGYRSAMHLLAAGLRMPAAEPEEEDDAGEELWGQADEEKEKKEEI